jgi:hypothetical protein
MGQLWGLSGPQFLVISGARSTVWIHFYFPIRMSRRARPRRRAVCRKHSPCRLEWRIYLGGEAWARHDLGSSSGLRGVMDLPGVPQRFRGDFSDDGKGLSLAEIQLTTLPDWAGNVTSLSNLYLNDNHYREYDPGLPVLH